MNRAALVLKIRQEEGYSKTPYRDTENVLTIGVGTNIEHMALPQGVVTMGEVWDWITDPGNHEMWLQKRIDDAIEDAENYVGAAWSGLSDARQRTLAEMAYQLGGEGLKAFVKLRQAILQDDWREASAQITNSLAARQTPARWRRHAVAMLNG